MEYYPLKDITTNQYWKLKVIDEGLALEENSETESQSNPVIQDSDGSRWKLVIDAGRLALMETSEAFTEFYLEDSQGNLWQVIARYGVIGIQKFISAYPSFTFTLDSKKTSFELEAKVTNFALSAKQLTFSEKAKQLTFVLN